MKIEMNENASFAAICLAASLAAWPVFGWLTSVTSNEIPRLTISRDMDPETQRVALEAWASAVKAIKSQEVR